MRRALPLELLAAVVVVPLALAACGGSSTPAASTTVSPSVSATSPTMATTSPTPSKPSTSASTTGALPQVKGDFGQVPTVTVPAGDPPSDLVVKTLHKGTGTTVAAGDVLFANYLGARWSGGATFDSSFGQPAPAHFAIGTGATIPGWDQALVGKTVGSRLLVVIPPSLGFGDKPPSGSPIQSGDTLVFVVDLVGTYSAGDAASGTPTPPEDDGTPAVSVLPKKPEIHIPAGGPPPNLVAIPVVTGKGPKVKSGDTIVVQYVGVLWRNGKQFDATWDGNGPFVTQIGTSAVIKGWDEGLVGQTVGSRVLLVVPPKLGYGPSGSGQIKGTDTLVFAVDILGSY